jgi:hypothetical protein
MEVSYSEGLANHIGPESCVGVGVRKGDDEALTGERTGWVLSREINAPPQGGLLRGADAVEYGGRQDLGRRHGKRLPIQFPPESGMLVSSARRSSHLFRT